MATLCSSRKYLCYSIEPNIRVRMTGTTRIKKADGNRMEKTVKAAVDSLEKLQQTLTLLQCSASSQTNY